MNNQTPVLDVVAVGNAVLDVLVQCDDSDLDRLGLEKGTMTLVEGARAEEIYASVGPGVAGSGGSAANTAAWIAALGGQVAFLGKVRDDELGATFTSDLRATGTRFRTAPAQNGPGTAHCLVLITPDAQRTMCTHLGVAGHLAVDDVDAELVETAAITFIEGYLVGLPTAAAAIDEATTSARRAGRQIALTLSDPTWVAAQRPAFSALLAQADIVLANELEAREITGEADADAALKALTRTCPVVAVTRSEHGAIVADATHVHTVPAEPVARVVDTTGAGDSFAAGFLAGLARGLDVETCARLGTVAAAEVISQVGARPEPGLAERLAQAGLKLLPRPT